jgi:hypothetical protein
MRIQPPEGSVFHTFLAVLFGVSLGTSIQAWRTLEKPREFVSVAKLVSTIELEPYFDGTYLKEPRLYISVIEILESEEMARRTKKRMSVQHPNLAQNSIKIEATRLQKSFIYQINATGTDPKFTKYALDSLIDEFLNLSEEVRKKMGSSGNGMIILERASSAVEPLKNWIIPIGIGALVGGMLALAAFFSARRLFPASPRLPAQ